MVVCFQSLDFLFWMVGIEEVDVPIKLVVAELEAEASMLVSIVRGCDELLVFTQEIWG